ncbi:LTA synthase family protein [Exiguobacterium sp. PFWT01]|uniref:LTA synthase family protein n=1 Tax=Exiguobacterium sp. PFWT01 TaxID=2829816 RepID=UPI001BAC6EDE|nr:LTA synthase family protein [Exiguobacterium sp. PFWT01]QUP88268.1 LTA synthase family protein [Exiguobacterium sp. PFWT01]
MNSSQRFSKLSTRLNDTVRASFQEYRLFWIFTLLLWTKTYIVYQFFFNIPIENTAQAFILLISPISSTLFLFAFHFFFKGNKQKWVLYTLYAIASFILFADAVYYREFTDYLTMPVIMQPSNMETLSTSFTSLLEWKDLIILGDVFVLPFILWRMNMKENVASHRRALVTFVVAVSVFLFNLSLAETERPELLTRSFDRELLVKNIGTFNFHVYDAMLQTKTSAQKAMADESELATIEQFTRQNYAAPNPDLFGKYKGKNVIVVSFESAQNFTHNMKAPNGEYITPNLNKLIEESHYWPNYYHTVGQGKTSDAEFALDNSLYGLPRGAVYFTNADNEFQALPELVKDENYYSAVFHANNKSFWNRDQMYKNIGVDQFFDEKSYDLGNPEDMTEWGLLDDSFFEQSIPMLQELPEPYYAKFITLTNHFPYTMPSEDYELVPKFETSSTTLNNFPQALAYQDYALGLFIDQLKENGMWEDTIFVVYGDHYGISTNHNSAMAELLGKDELTPFDVAKLQQVPFAIHLPDQKEGEVHETIGSHVDMKPTILHLLGIDTSDTIGFGNDLFSENRNSRAIFRDGTVVTDEYVWTQSTCYNATSGEVVEDTSLCGPMTEEAEKILQMNDDLIYSDLLRFKEQTEE